MLCKIMFKYYIIFALCSAVNCLKLKQVVVLSRHGIRTPLVPGLEIVTNKKWPTWDFEQGYLTAKGSEMERIMGKYFSDWLISEYLLDSNCPSDDEVFVHANTRQRTKETAKSFVEGAFGNCVNVYAKNTTGDDPVFNVFVRNASEEFRNLVLEEVQKKLDNLDMKEEFSELDDVLDFKNSTFCETTLLCKLGALNRPLILEVGQEPRMAGSFRIGYGVVDAFLMAYYEGMESSDMGFNDNTSEERWRLLMNILSTVYDLQFRTNYLNKDVARLLLEYMKSIFLNGDRKFHLLVGHDANIHAILSILNFKDYILHDQYEVTPIGGKVVFQKWYDEEIDRDLLRVDYVYQSTKQIRDGADLNLQNPPQWQLLEMDHCVVDENGFCPWEVFLKVLKDA